MSIYYGKYRGTVVDNQDPEERGRLQISCPGVYGDNTMSWAMPSVPYAAKGKGFYFIPPIGANVWIDFEAGDSNYPIWSGCFWERKEAPSQQPAEKIIKTDYCTITLADEPNGKITIETSGGMKIELTDKNINVTNGNATVELNQRKVLLNSGALEVE